MTSDRPYRRALSHEAALTEIRAHTGSQFCPIAAAAVLEVLDAPAGLATPLPACPESDEGERAIEAEPEGHDARHDRAADAHDEDSKRHDQAAWYWSHEGDPDKASLARRNAVLDRELADIDRESARLERTRAQ